jgi:hypothetical protein
MPIPLSKQWRTTRKSNGIVQKSVKVFEAQYKFIKFPGKDIETTKGINKRALGYLEGFMRSAMRAQQLEITNEDAIAVFASLLEKLWGKELGVRYFEYWKVSMKDDETKNGAKTGGMDFSFSSTTGRQPKGLYGCFKDEKEETATIE